MGESQVAPQNGHCSKHPTLFRMRSAMGSMSSYSTVSMSKLLKNYRKIYHQDFIHQMSFFYLFEGINSITGSMKTFFDISGHNSEVFDLLNSHVQLIRCILGFKFSFVFEFIKMFLTSHLNISVSLLNHSFGSKSSFSFRRSWMMFLISWIFLLHFISNWFGKKSWISGLDLLEIQFPDRYEVMREGEVVVETYW